MSTIRTRTLLFLVAILLAFKPLSALDTNINVPIDFDSRNVRAGTAGTPTINTNAGFLSWDTTGFGDMGGSSSSSFSSQGVNFELRGLRPSPVPGDDPLPALSFGSRNRGSANGGPFDDLLQDLVFAEGGPDAFVYLKITGLPIGQYQITSWHYDQFIVDVTPAPNYMQIEVGDQVPGRTAAATSIVLDHFLMGTLPQNFKFTVLSPTVAKELVFRNDGPAPGVLGDTVYRARLNGFVLTSVPEPTSSALIGMLIATLLSSPCFVRRRRSDRC